MLFVRRRGARFTGVPRRPAQAASDIISACRLEHPVCFPPLFFL